MTAAKSSWRLSDPDSEERGVQPNQVGGTGGGVVAAATRRALTLHARSEPTCGPSSRFGWACAREGVAGARADGWLLASLAPGLARDAPPGHAGHVCVAQRRKRRGCQLDCICGACLGHRRGGSRGLAEAGRRVRWRCGGACAAVEVARGARKGGGEGGGCAWASKRHTPQTACQGTRRHHCAGTGGGVAIGGQLPPTPPSFVTLRFGPRCTRRHDNQRA